MKKILFVILIAVLGLFALLIIHEDGTVATKMSPLEHIWFDELTDAERAQACFGYAFYTQQEIMVQLITEPDPVDPKKAEEFYRIMEREC